MLRAGRSLPTEPMLSLFAIRPLRDCTPGAQRMLLPCASCRRVLGTLSSTLSVPIDDARDGALDWVPLEDGVPGWLRTVGEPCSRASTSTMRVEGMLCRGGCGGTSSPSLTRGLRPLPALKLAMPDRKFQEEPVRSTSKLPVVCGEPRPPDEVVGGLDEVLVSLPGCRHCRRRRPSAYSVSADGLLAPCDIRGVGW